MVATALVLRTLPLAALTPAAYNPRLHLRPGQPAYEKLARSLRTFGLVEPLVWNERSGHVVGGHARLAILRELGVTEVPVSVVRLDAAAERALNVVLNNRDAQGTWDTAKLADLLAELRDLPELEATGFDAKALAALSFTPAAVAAEEPEPPAVEVLLAMPPEAYAAVEGPLNELVRTHGLTAHVRRR